MKKHGGILLVLTALVALSACTPATKAGPSGTGIEVGEGASSTQSPAVQRCLEAGKTLMALTEGLALDATRATYEDNGLTNCTWTSGGKVALGLTAGAIGGNPSELLEQESETVLHDPQAATLGGVVLLGSAGATLAEAGAVSLVLPEQTLTLQAAGDAAPRASVEDAIASLADLNKLWPATGK